MSNKTTENTENEVKKQAILIEWSEDDKELDVEVKQNIDDTHAAMHILAIVLQDLANKNGESLGVFMIHHALKYGTGEQEEEMEND